MNPADGHIRALLQVLRGEGVHLAEFHPDGSLSRVVLGAAPPPVREGDAPITALERAAGESSADKSIDERLFGKMPGFVRRKDA